MDTANDNNGDTSRMLVQLTVADLQSLVRLEVERAVHAVVEATRPQPVSERWIDVAGAAKHFCVSPQTIRNWVRMGAPARTFGAPSHPLIRIDLPAFAAWVEQGRSTPESNG